jgi:hypothetical protein
MATPNELIPLRIRSDAHSLILMNDQAVLDGVSRASTAILALKFVYVSAVSKANLISVPDGMSVLVYNETRSY